MRPIRGMLLRVLTLSLTFFPTFSTITIKAQSAGATSASITGRVIDNAGATIPGAMVKAKNLATNLTREISADEEGSYLISQLPPGSYEISTIAEGFKAVTSRVELVLGTTTLFNFTMQLGEVSDIVIVKAENFFEAGKTESSTNIDPTGIDSLPINRRNFMDFSLTAPRVSPDRVPTQGVAASSGISFNGQPARYNNITIDGLDNNESAAGSSRSTFSQDAVQEFQIISDSYSAEFGRAAAGVINIITKGGGNEYHGNLFSFIRNDSISARD